MPDFLKVLEENNILVVEIPPNYTDRLQPLDLAVNKPLKDQMKRHSSGMSSMTTVEQTFDKNCFLSFSKLEGSTLTAVVPFLFTKFILSSSHCAQLLVISM